MPILISLQNTLVFEQPTSARPDRPNHFNYLEAVFNHNFNSFSLASYCISIIPKRCFQLLSVLEIDASSNFGPFPQDLSQLPLGITPLSRQHYWTQHNQFSENQSLNTHSLFSFFNLQLEHPKPHFWDQFPKANFSHSNQLTFFGGAFDQPSNARSLTKLQRFQLLSF